MNQVWLYSIVSVLVISLISLIGVLTISVNVKKLRKFLIYMVSFSAGALLGDVFIHLLPETVEKFGFGINTSLYVLFGILVFFVSEKIVKWRHCHMHYHDDHVHSFAVMNLIGDGFHNFMDGLIIAGSYLVSIPVGIASTLAVAFHEIPQEIGDFGVLLQGGYSKKKALLFNFLISLTAVLGVVLALILGNYFENITSFLIPFAAGGFIYIAGADLIPELHREVKVRKSVLQLLFIILGIAVMYSLLFFGI
jgi:zinc and cadmium transporter